MNMNYNGVNEFVAAKFNDKFGSGVLFRVGESNLFNKIYDDGCSGGHHIEIKGDEVITEKFYTGDALTIIL